MKEYIKIIEDAAGIGLYLQIITGSWKPHEIRFYIKNHYTWIDFRTIKECMEYTKDKVKSLKCQSYTSK